MVWVVFVVAGVVVSPAVCSYGAAGTAIGQDSMAGIGAGDLTSANWQRIFPIQRLVASRAPNAATGHRGSTPVSALQSGNFIVRASVATGGAQADGGSYGPRISGDGRYVAFTSDAGNLAPGDNYAGLNVFLRDLIARRTEQIDLASDGAASSGRGIECDISSSAQYVAFIAEARLVAGASGRNVFIRDRAGGTTQCASFNDSRTPANCNYCEGVCISGSGRNVVFVAPRNCMITGDTSPVAEVFSYDRQTDTTVVLARTPEDEWPNMGCYSPATNEDGSVIIFESEATNLVAGDRNGKKDLFVFSGVATNLARMPMGYDGSESNGASMQAAVSSDGRYVAFVSEASNLVPGDTNGCGDVFVYDRATGNTERVSVADDGTQANGDSGGWAGRPDISADGRYVAFGSFANNLVPGDTNAASDVFVFDRQTRTIRRVSISFDGKEANGRSYSPSLSADGRYVAFTSFADNLVPDDTNGAWDVFVVDVTRLPTSSDPADFNRNGSVDEQDIAFFIKEYAKAAAGQPWDRRVDLTGDGELDYRDADLLVGAFLGE